MSIDNYYKFDFNDQSYIDVSMNELTTTNNVGFKNFTIEWWQYLIPDKNNIFDTDYTIFSVTSSITHINFFIRIVEGLPDPVTVIYGVEDNFVELTPVVQITNKWVHFAIVRNLLTTRIYLNGNLFYTTSIPYNINILTNHIFIGSDNFPTNFFNGYIAAFNWILDNAKYTTNFIPQFPFTTTTNTKLLLQVNKNLVPPFVEDQNNNIINDISYNSITVYVEQPVQKKICVCPSPATFSGKQGGFFGGNNNYSHIVTRASIYSHTILTATNFGRKGSTRTKFANKQLNPFGRWEGAPGGYGRPIRNKF